MSAEACHGELHSLFFLAIKRLRFTMKYTIISLLSLFAFSSCSSIVSKSQYPVSFTNEGAPVKFKVRKKSGEVIHSGITPSTVTLPASEGYFQRAAYEVTSSKGVAPLNASLDPWYVGNVAIGGLIGLVIVDPLTGSMWKLPKEVKLHRAPHKLE